MLSNAIPPMVFIPITRLLNRVSRSLGFGPNWGRTRAFVSVGKLIGWLALASTILIAMAAGVAVATEIALEPKMIADRRILRHCR